MQISFSIDKKLVLLVIIVSTITLLITAYLSFNYAEQILIERANDLLLGESTVRVNAVKLLFESRIEQNQILANDPMIKILVKELSETPENEFDEVRENKRGDFLTKVQGVKFNEAYPKRKLLPLDNFEVPVISYHDLVVVKMLAGRPQDVADVDVLQKINKDKFNN